MYIWLKIVIKIRLSVSQKPWDPMQRTVCDCFKERWAGNVLDLFTLTKTHFTTSFGAAYVKCRVERIKTFQSNLLT